MFMGNNMKQSLVGGIPTPLKKYESQLGSLFPKYGKIKNVPNHQPDHVSEANPNLDMGD